MKTLLQGTNEVLKRVQIVSENNLLTSLTNSGKQVFIDLAIQAWNEAVDQLYSKAKTLKPYQAEEDLITIVSGQRVYSLPDDLIQMRFPLHEETEGLYLEEYPGGYEELRNIQSQPANYTGLPLSAAISPIEKELYLDRIPGSSEAGFKYKFFYWRDTVLEKASDTFPFDDGVFRALVPVVSEVWKLMQQNKFNSGTVKLSYGRALRMVKQTPADRTYIKRNVNVNYGPLGFSPFDSGRGR